MKALSAAVACLLLNAACVKYQARVLNPPQIEAKLRSRTLAATGLEEFVRVQTGKPDLGWPPATLDPETLTAVAWFFSPGLDVARAEVEAAKAAVITARQRINPSIDGYGGRNKTPDSIATYAITPLFTIETRGKRALRILAAEKAVEAARIGVYQTAWEVRAKLRNAMSACLVAEARHNTLKARDTLLAEIEDIFEKRLQAGDAARPELNQAQANRTATSIALRYAEGEVAKSKTAVAAAVGLPVEILRALPLDLSSLAQPSTPAAERARRAGLLHRTDIRRALVDYEEVDVRLRLAVANQYPNIVIAPGYQYQEGFSQYTLGSLLDSLPILHRHTGPIAEREAARKLAEVQFVALEAKVVAEASVAATGYSAAIAAWTTAGEALDRVSRQKETAAAAALRAGEAGHLELVTARLEGSALRGSRDDFFENLQGAMAALEDAMQASVYEAMPLPPGEKVK